MNSRSPPLGSSVGTPMGSSPITIYDLLQTEAALDKTCALLVSSETSGRGELPPSCKFHGPFPSRRRL